MKEKTKLVFVFISFIAALYVFYYIMVEIKVGPEHLVPTTQILRKFKQVVFDQLDRCR